MSEGPLTAEAILVATEGVLRRHGPAKATVLDVARALGVSHGSVYRHFPTKAALRGAVTERWLDRTQATLSEVLAEDGPARHRVGRWLRALFDAKRRKALDDPELFATYSVLVGEHSEVVARHLNMLIEQLTGILREGASRGELDIADPARTARAVFGATVLFHDPAHAGDWSDPGIEADFDEVCSLVLEGLRGGQAR